MMEANLGSARQPNVTVKKDMSVKRRVYNLYLTTLCFNPYASCFKRTGVCWILWHFLQALQVTEACRHTFEYVHVCASRKRIHANTVDHSDVCQVRWVISGVTGIEFKLFILQNK